MALKLPDDYYGKTPGANAQYSARPEDVSSTTAIIHAMYKCISGPPGQPRDWDRMDSLCIPGSRSIRTGELPDGKTGCKILSNDEYRNQMESWLVNNGFFETEIHRVEERFGNIAHVFSTYESRRAESDPQPFMRGINSIQLMYDGSRWWIVTVMWQHESEAHPIPDSYLPDAAQ